ncbi:hypothetical protein CBA19C8_35105 [Paraburkholderia terrae]|nr:hypothetical protein CBA19C8_35105 [Paraburkholderia terrae]
MLSALKRAGAQYTDDFQEDFVLGNIKARQRMIAQYAIAGARAGVVIGTDHAAEPLIRLLYQVRGWGRGYPSACRPHKTTGKGIGARAWRIRFARDESADA